MIDERMMIEYSPIRPEGHGGERQHEVRAEVEELVDRRVDTSPPSVSIPDVGNQPRPAAKMMISGMPMTKYGIEYRTRLSAAARRGRPAPPRLQPAYEPRAAARRRSR